MITQEFQNRIIKPSHHRRQNVGFEFRRVSVWQLYFDGFDCHGSGHGGKGAATEIMAMMNDDE